MAIIGTATSFEIAIAEIAAIGIIKTDLDLKIVIMETVTTGIAAVGITAAGIIAVGIAAMEIIITALASASA